MAYIGYNPSQLAVAPFAVKSFTGDGSTTTFTLDQSVPGANEANVEVVVENVQQNPIDAYTIGGNLNNSLIFSEAPVSGAAIYVIHKGEATYNLQPSTGSVTAATLDPVLRNFTVDNFTGNGSATTYTLTDTPYSANSILVTVDGIVQTASTNYTVSGTTLSFGASAPDSGAIITVVHMGFSSGNKAVMDGSITPVKLSTGGPWWTSGGNFGVGTTSPALKVDVNGSIKMSGGSGTALTWDTSISSQYIKYDSTLNGLIMNGYAGLAYYTNGAERMRLDSSGNVGIGTSSPKWDLTFATYAGRLVDFTNTTADLPSVLAITSIGTASEARSIISFQNLSQTTGSARMVQIQAERTNVSTTALDADFVVNVSKTGTLTEALRVVSTGALSLPFGQIKFPASQNASSDANTLDDYEEGTWTPVISNGATNVTAYYWQAGTYRKIGNMVWIQVQISVYIVGLSSGNLQITGLPFPLAQQPSLGGATRVFVYGTKYAGSPNGAISLAIDAGAPSKLTPYLTSDLATELTYASLTPGGQWHFQGCYATS